MGGSGSMWDYQVDRGQLGSFLCVFFFQAEDGIRDLVRSRGLGDVYKRQVSPSMACLPQIIKSYCLILANARDKA